MGMCQLSGIYPLFLKKWLKPCSACASIIVDRRKAWVMPESKYSIGGIKNGISILFLCTGARKEVCCQGSTRPARRVGEDESSLLDL